MRRLGLLVFASLLIEGMAHAQPCPVDLRPADASYGYRQRASPNRCEGMYASPIAGEAIEMLSFTFGRWQEPAGGPLLITAPDLHGLSAVSPPKVAVVGRALPLRVYYRLDTTLQPTGSTTWPVDQVVLPAGLTPRDIGLVGVVKTDEGNVYVPLAISRERAQIPDVTPQMIFRAPVDLDNFQWRLYRQGQSVPWNNKGAAQAGDAVILSLDNLARGSPMTLEVAAKPAVAPYVQSRFKIFRP
jgi:hypothetical protein